MFYTARALRSLVLKLLMTQIYDRVFACVYVCCTQKEALRWTDKSLKMYLMFKIFIVSELILNTNGNKRPISDRIHK
jgi:hypothetical protein